MTFMHGIDHQDMESGGIPVKEVRSSVIGVIGTAPKGELNKPILINSPKKGIEIFGDDQSFIIPRALKGIFSQTGALCVVINVDTKKPSEETILKKLLGQSGRSAGSAKYMGIDVFLSAKSICGYAPKLLIAPGLSSHQEVSNKLSDVASKLWAIGIPDGPNTTDDEAMKFAENFSSSRLYPADPWYKVDEKTTVEASPYVAGLIARVDDEEGFWVSPSNHTINGIVGTDRPIDFALGDANCTANLLNEKRITTVIREDGFRLWGNLNTGKGKEAKYQFISVRRTADMINESIMRSHLWAVDRNINKGYIEEVTESINNYIRDLKTRGAVLGGLCWVDPEVNTNSQIKQGNIYFDYDFTPPYPAQKVTFRSHMVDNYLTEVF